MDLLLGHEDMDVTDFPDSVNLVLRMLPGVHYNNDIIIKI